MLAVIYRLYKNHFGVEQMPPIPEANKASVDNLEALLRTITEKKVVVIVDDHTVSEVSNSKVVALTFRHCHSHGKPVRKEVALDRWKSLVQASAIRQSFGAKSFRNKSLTHSCFQIDATLKNFGCEYSLVDLKNVPGKNTYGEVTFWRGVVLHDGDKPLPVAWQPHVVTKRLKSVKETYCVFFLFVGLFCQSVMALNGKEVY
ncbi:hypothetical protein D918_09319 [Trichuris suis]|nr:hypothetical protein D918_09319 [Trichuris suis]